MRLMCSVSVIALIAAIGGCGGPQERNAPHASEEIGPEVVGPADERAAVAAVAEQPTPEGAADFERSPDGVMVEEIRRGDGARVAPGSLVVARLVGRIEGGPVFHRTENPEGPWPVEALVEGLTRGMQEMREGGRRRITIPPALAYGDDPVTDAETGETIIPAGSTLIYDVEIVEVLDRSAGVADAPAEPPSAEEDS